MKRISRADPLELTEAAFIEQSEEGGAYCVDCRAYTTGKEPDTRGDRCDSCDERGNPAFGLGSGTPRGVFGVEELLALGYLVLTD